MRQLCEFRVNEKYAHMLFAEGEGTLLGDDVRKVNIETSDIRFPRMNILQSRLREKGESFFWGHHLHYVYTNTEIKRAVLFSIWITAAFEPTGEECGTEFDDSETCLECGAGRKQISDLVLDLRKAPRTKDIARTIADEWIITQRLAELMVDAKLTGFDLQPVRHKARYQDDPLVLSTVPSGRKLLNQARSLGIESDEWEFHVWLNRPKQRVLCEAAHEEHAARRTKQARRRFKPPPVWYQLVVTSNPVPMVPPTRTGIDPFDDDPKGEYRCPYGHVVGLNLLSEVFVERKTYDASDVIRTSNLVGHRMGLLVPSPCLLISQRFYRLLKQHKIKGYKTEVAYLV